MVETKFKDVPKSKIRKGDQVTWVSNYKKFGFVRRKFKANVSMPKQGDFLPYNIKKGQEVYDLMNPWAGTTNTTIIPVSKIKKARRKA